MRARGFVTFQFNHALDRMMLIPLSTRVYTDEGHRFLTKWSYAIEAGEREVSIEVEAEVHGRNHNVRANSITLVDNRHMNSLSMSQILRVFNRQPMTGGADNEVERVRPAPLSDPLAGNSASAWNRSIERIDQFRRRLRMSRPATEMEVWRD